MMDKEIDGFSEIIKSVQNIHKKLWKRCGKVPAKNYNFIKSQVFFLFAYFLFNLFYNNIK